MAGQFKHSQYAAIMYWAYGLLHKPHCYRTVYNWLMLDRIMFEKSVKKGSIIEAIDLGLLFDPESDLSSEKLGDNCCIVCIQTKTKFQKCNSSEEI